MQFLKILVIASALTICTATPIRKERSLEVPAGEGAAAKEAKEYLENAETLITGTLAASVFGVEPTFDQFRETVYKLVAQMMSLSLEGQKEVRKQSMQMSNAPSFPSEINAKATVTEALGFEFTDDRERILEEAWKKHDPRTHIDQFFSYMIEQDEVMGNGMKSFYDNMKSHYEKLSDEGKNFVEQATSLLINKLVTEFEGPSSENEESKEDRDFTSMESIQPQLHKLFTDMSMTVRTEVLREMTFFATPSIRNAYDSLIKALRELYNNTN